MFRSRMLAFKMAIPAGQAFPYRRGEVTEALSITLLILGGRVSVKQAALFDGSAFDPFSFELMVRSRSNRTRQQHACR